MRKRLVLQTALGFPPLSHESETVIERWSNNGAKIYLGSLLWAVSARPLGVGHVVRHLRDEAVKGEGGRIGQRDMRWEGDKRNFPTDAMTYKL